MKHLFCLTTFILLGSALLHAQDSGANDEERVKYTLILPEEKSPELVKPDENNPFETIAEQGSSSDGDTEENRVRDLLLAMPVGGAVHGPDGMRVMLGGMRLQAGIDVPPVLPEQQVQLRVHSITPESVELVWVEKRPTGLPPKMLVIPMDGTPTVRYRMPSPGRGGTGGGIGTIRKNMVFQQPAPPPSAAVASGRTPEPGVSSKEQATPEPPSAPPPPPSNVSEGSVYRMLFGRQPKSK